VPGSTIPLTRLLPHSLSFLLLFLLKYCLFLRCSHAGLAPPEPNTRMAWHTIGISRPGAGQQTHQPPWSEESTINLAIT